MPYRTETGPCWYCSNQYATKYFSWYYDQYGYYRYYNSCQCNHLVGCGAYGYVQNEYCPACHASYPTVAVSYKRTYLGYMTLTKQCSACPYYYHVEGWT